MSDSDSSESLTSMFIRPVSVCPRAHLGAVDSSAAVEKMLCTVSGRQRRSHTILGLLWLN